MFSWFKNLFMPPSSCNKETPPGRTFKRILTNDYFGLSKEITDLNRQTEARKKKLAQIKEYGLLPAYITYYYQNQKIVSAKIAFQKEELAEKWHMLHITEISFLLYVEEFELFETMTQLKLTEDFRDVTPEYNAYKGDERRKNIRETMYT